MRVRIKICGLTSRETVEAAVAAGADAVGLVFADSPRRIDPGQGAALVRDLPPHVASVAVFRCPSRELVREVLFRVVPGWIQIDAEDLARLDLPPDLRILPVFRDHHPGALSPEDYLARCRRARPRILLERDGGEGEGSGWPRVAGLAAATRLMLAGGLNPENVGEAIQRVRPYGVDVSRGVELRPGVKDPVRIAAFVRAARAAERRETGFLRGGFR